MADFEIVKYQTDKGNIFNCRMDSFDAVQTVAGDEPAGAVTENLTILVSKSDREFGIRPRLAIYGRPLGQDNVPGDRYVRAGTAYKRVAILTAERFNALNKDTAPNIVIGGVTFAFKSKMSERVR